MPTSNARKQKREAARIANKTGTSSIRSVETAPMSEISSPLSSLAEIERAASIESTRLDENPDIEIRGVAGAGRGLFWAAKDGRSIEPGTTLLRLQPELVIPDETTIATRCYVCFDDGKEKTLTACTKCRLVRYCSALCRVKDAGAHEYECKGLQACLKAQRAAPNHVVEPGRNERAIARVCTERRRLGDKWWAPLKALLVHRSELDGNEDLLKRATHLLNMAGLQAPDMDELNGIYSRLSSSSFIANAHDHQAIYGMMIQSTAALINHSCLQNVAIVVPNGYGVKNPLHVVAIKEIKPGEELTISYSTVHQPYSMRQEGQQKHWFFNCRCHLCLKSEKNQCTCSSCKPNGTLEVIQDKDAKVWIDPREAFFCGRSDCNGWLLKCRSNGMPVGTCSKCKQVTNYDVNFVPGILKNAEALLKRIEESIHDDDAIDELFTSGKSIIKLLTLIQPPCAYPCFDLLRMFAVVLKRKANMLNRSGRTGDKGYVDEEILRFSYLEMAAWNAGGKYCIMPYGHPVRPLTIASMAEMQMLGQQIVRKDSITGQLKERPSDFLARPHALPRGEARQTNALELMKKALEEGKIAFGKEGGGLFDKKMIKKVHYYEDIMEELLDLNYRNRPGTLDIKSIDLSESGMDI